MRHQQLLICLSLLLFIPLSAKAFPPPSPAGGNYLALDGVDDYAVLDFETFGLPLPEGTDEFTIEAWIYPTTPPDDKHTKATVLCQQVQMYVVIDEFPPLIKLVNGRNIEHPKGDLILMMGAHMEGVFGTTLSFPVPLVPNQWHHIALQSNGHETANIVNDFVWTLQHGTPIGGDNVIWRRPKDFVLGGFGKKIEMPIKDNPWFWGAFTGYIDEVRISTEARYAPDKKAIVPRSAFKTDVKTIALWHFDEPGGTGEFSDASGNVRHLVGKNGAQTGIPLAAEAAGKLTTTWGRLKQ